MTRPNDIDEATWEGARGVMLDSPFSMEASDYVDDTIELIARALISAKAEGMREAAGIADALFNDDRASVGSRISKAILSSIQKEPT